MSDAPARTRAKTDTFAPEMVSLGEATRVWAKMGLQSFGGPAAQIALMHEELVEKRRWISEARFLHALAYCMLLPGPEATQLATYVGWLMHKTRGGVVAGVLFVLPGFLFMLGLSALYAGFHDLPVVAALFFGMKAAVLAIVLEALLRIRKRALTSPRSMGIALGAFVALFFFEAPFPAVVVAAGLFGLVGSRVRPEWFPKPPEAANVARAASTVDHMEARGELAHTKPSSRRAATVVAVFGGLWALPFAILIPLFGTKSVFVEEALFFSKTAVVTFGGAYAVLAYIAQEAVSTFGWLRPGEMLDGLGLAETTPGPLILVTELVGFLGAYRAPGLLSPMLAGVIGACVTAWVTFVPCFLWIFLGGPYIESLRGHRALHAALGSITAAIVGVIANLTVWLFAHTLFRSVSELHFGTVRLVVPALRSMDILATALAGLSLVFTFRWKLGLPKTLAMATLLGLVARGVLKL
jgi:chromate transporter